MVTFNVEVLNHYFSIFWGKPGFVSQPSAVTEGPVLRTLCLVTVFKFSIFEQGDLHFHFALGFTNYVGR